MANEIVTSSGEGFGFAMSSVGADTGAGGGVAVVWDAVADSIDVPCEVILFNEYTKVPPPLGTVSV